MNIEKIKSYVLENKKYVALIAILAFLGIFLLRQNQQQNDFKSAEQNQELLSKETKDDKMASSQSASSMSHTNNVTCDISGAIRHQGVYTLKTGARLQELIDAAGGLTSRAQIKAINRAVLLKDQDKIYIPYKGEKVAVASTRGTATGGSSATSSNDSETKNEGEKVNLNTASAADLQKLNGIGEKKAEKIIAYREQNGEFKKIEDLMQVSGIGEKTFAALKDQLAL